MTIFWAPIVLAAVYRRVCLALFLVLISVPLFKLFHDIRIVIPDAHGQMQWRFPIPSHLYSLPHGPIAHNTDHIIPEQRDITWLSFLAGRINVYSSANYCFPPVYFFNGCRGLFFKLFDNFSMILSGGRTQLSVCQCSLDFVPK